MDPDTQGYLDRVRARNERLKNKANKLPLSETNNRLSPRKSNSSSPSKIIKSITTEGGESKENCDVAVEINILTSSNIQVDVQVEERQLEDGETMDTIFKRVENANAIKNTSHAETAENCTNNETERQEAEQPILRTTSKHKLQRLGALYSEEGDISSPIHRTERKFDEETSSARKNESTSRVGGRGARIDRFAKLASTINNWEDDVIQQPKTKYRAPSPPKQTLAQRSGASPIRSPNKITEQINKINEENIKNPTSSPVKTCSPSRERSPVKSISPSKAISPSKSVMNSPTKQLKWDQKVLKNLESQGYKRAEESSNLVYDYANTANTDQNNKVTPSKPFSRVVNPSETPKIINAGATKPSIKKNKAPDVPKPSYSGTQVKIVDTLTKVSKKSLFNDEPSSSGTKITSPVKKQQTDSTRKSPGSPQKTAPQPKLTKSAAMLSKTALFENASPRTKEKDPAELSVQERLALFEKNKGTALIPKAAFGMAPNVKSLMQKEVKVHEPSAPPMSNSEDTSSSNGSLNYCSGGIKDKMAALFGNNEKTISQTQISQQTKLQKQKDLDLLLNRFNKPKEKVPEPQTKEVSERAPMPPPAPKMPEPTAPYLESNSKGSSPAGSPKRVKIISPRNGNLYPTLSSLDCKNFSESESYDSDSQDNSSVMGPLESDSDMASDSQMDSSDATGNISLGHEILEAVHKGYSPKKYHPTNTLSSNSSDDISDVLGDMNCYLDKALTADCEQGPTPPKRGRCLSPDKSVTTSTSFSYKPGSPSKYQQVLSIDTVDSPQKDDYEMTDASESCESQPQLPLMHTVSFYRKQTQQGVKSPIRQITHKAEDSSTEKESVYDESELVQNKIQLLTEEVSRQQIIISQSSQALNLCEATIEFSGSSEQVDGEKHLLVATHRRQAALNEIQRLRVEGYIRPAGAPTEKGSLHINAITLPLRADYIRNLATDTHPGHHLVCLIRHQERVLSTQIICTLPGLHSMRFQDSVRMEDMYADFKVTLEVYGMEAKKQLLPHEVKYHIGSKKPSKGTPMKSIKGDSKLARPVIQSPAGPNAVRSPQLALLGYVIFSLKEIQRQQWTLMKPAPGSPLDGNIQMRLSCELSVSVQHQGFLTMYEDVSGFGAWHRRWCVLNGHILNFWKYPDDESKKAPMGSLDLRGCSTSNVGLVSRDICARLHTLMLEFTRPIRDTDKESLVILKKGKEVIVRHLLSADTKEERVEWCVQFNKALNILRAWGSTQN